MNAFPPCKRNWKLFVESIEKRNFIEAQIHQRAATFIVRRQNKSYSISIDVDLCYQTEEELEFRLENARRVQSLMSRSLRRLRCLREITSDMLASMQQPLSQPAVAIPKVIKTDASILRNSQCNYCPLERIVVVLIPRIFDRVFFSYLICWMQNFRFHLLN